MRANVIQPVIMDQIVTHISYKHCGGACPYPMTNMCDAALKTKNGRLIMTPFLGGSVTNPGLKFFIKKADFDRLSTFFNEQILILGW